MSGFEKARLMTRAPGSELVAEIDLPCFDPRAEIVCWGQRWFVLKGITTAGEAAQPGDFHGLHYFEAVVWVAPTEPLVLRPVP